MRAQYPTTAIRSRPGTDFGLLLGDVTVDPLDYATDGKNPDLHSLDTLMFEMNTSDCNPKPVTQVFLELDV
jgi:hypothetical protein